jgi:hypothetical protein
MIGPHWPVSIFGMGLIAGVGTLMYVNVSQYFPFIAKVAYIAGMVMALVSYLIIFCKFFFLFLFCFIMFYILFFVSLFFNILFLK